MGVALALFPVAPLDRTARLVTLLIWAVAAAFAVAGAVLVGAAEQAVGFVFLVVALVTGGLAWWLRGREPVAYLVEDDGLVVERKHAPPRRFVGRLAHARRGKLGLRVAGDGGVYGYLGKFRADGKTVSAFVTSLSDVVLLRVGEAELAISPTDPDSFLATTTGGGHA